MNVCTAVHACKQMQLEANSKEAKETLELNMIDVDIAYIKGKMQLKEKVQYKSGRAYFY